MSETELLRAYLEGDELAFCELYMRHIDKLVGFFMMKCKDRSLCKDLVHDTFYRLLNSKAFKGNSIEEFGNYIISIAFSAWSEYFQKCKSQSESEDEWKRASYQDIENGNQEEQIKRLELAINQLPTKEQIRAINLWRKGKSYQEIAEIMDKTVVEVTNLIYRAKRNLRRLTSM